MSGTGVVRQGDGTYVVSSPRNIIRDDYTPKIVKFLKILNSEIDDYYTDFPDRITNYEDLCYVASQIHDSESGEYDNPVVGTLVKKLLEHHAQVFHKATDDGRHDLRMIDISAEATNYIQDIAKSMLERAPKGIDHLEFIRDCRLDSDFENLDIFTLNHDTLVEQSVTAQNIPLIDGFDLPADGLRPWKPSLYESATGKDIRLFKLHGSINWFWFDSRPNPILAIPLTKDIWHMGDKLPMPLSGRPEMLVGTFNKMLSYSKTAFSDLYCSLCKSLNNTARLVISGFSFNDKAINSRIIEWMISNNDRRLVIIHDEPPRLKLASRPAIARKIDQWIKDDRLRFVAKRIENTCWDEIRAQL